MRSYRREIERLVPQLRQYARALVAGHRADIADDLVHEALAQALKAERGWMGEDVAVKLYSRVIGANRHRIRAELGARRSAPGAALQADTRTGDFDAGGHSVEGHGLETLSLSEREALLLVMLGRLDYSKVAEILAVPLATVIGRLTHARERLGASLWMMPHGPKQNAATRSQRTATHLRLVKS